MAPPWLDVLDETIHACAARGRRDLVRLLEDRRTRLLDPRLRVLVVGTRKQGKSQLVNAIVNAPACVVGDETGTTVPTVVQHAEEPSAVLVTGRADRTPVPVDEVGALAPRRPVGGAAHLEVGLPRTLLRSGLVLVDMPPLDGAAEPGYAEAGLDGADAVLMVSDARREITRTELDFLVRAGRSCPQVLVVLTKIDLSPDWRRTAQRNREHLAEAGLPAHVLPVSADLRLRAAKTDDRALNAESGFAELVACLQQYAATKAERIAPHTAAAVTTRVLESLAEPLLAQRSAAAGQLEDLQRSLERLRRQSARWQNGLADDIADLASDVEYDLRDRTRRIIRTVDEFFDTADPAEVWDAFTPWLEENLRNAAEANFGWLVERSHWIAARIARDLAAYRADVLPDSTFWMPDQVFDSMSELERPSFGHFSLAQKLFTGLRGSYGGVVMFGLLTSLAGLPLINVVSIGAGAAFGGKTLRDEGGSRLQRRQAIAKATVQRHIEDFFLKFSKECRDVARQVHRALRDHFSGLLEQLQDGLVEAARDAQRRSADDALQREYEALQLLYRRVQQVSAPAQQGIAA